MSSAAMAAPVDREWRWVFAPQPPDCRHSETPSGEWTETQRNSYHETALIIYRNSVRRNHRAETIPVRSKGGNTCHLRHSNRWLILSIIKHTVKRSHQQHIQYMIRSQVKGWFTDHKSTVDSLTTSKKAGSLITSKQADSLITSEVKGQFTDHKSTVDSLLTSKKVDSLLTSKQADSLITSQRLIHWQHACPFTFDKKLRENEFGHRGEEKTNKLKSKLPGKKWSI